MDQKDNFDQMPMETGNRPMSESQRDKEKERKREQTRQQSMGH